MNASARNLSCSVAVGGQEMASLLAVDVMALVVRPSSLAA